MDSFKLNHFNASKYEDKIVKVIVKNKTKPKVFDKFLDKIYLANPYEVKITEILQESSIQNEEDIEIENTMTILSKYIENADVDINKNKVQNLARKIYKQACDIS